MGQPTRRPKLAATFQSVLELTACGFHGAGTNRGVAGGHVGIVEVVAVVLEVMDFPIDDWIGRIPGQQFLERVDHAMLRSVAQIIEKELDPSGGQFGAIGVKMAGEAPEVFAAVIEVQGFGRFEEAIFDQVPYPDGTINDDEHFFGASQPQEHCLGLDPGIGIVYHCLGF